jgi:hypothetical protein
MINISRNNYYYFGYWGRENVLEGCLRYNID